MSIAPLRPLDAFPYEDAGRRLIGLRDPLGVVEGILGVSPEAYYIATHFDGGHGAGEVAEIVSVNVGGRLSAEMVERVRAVFSEHGLLFDHVFQKIYQNAREAFARTPMRPAAHAGSNYPEDPEEFRSRIEGILKEGNSPAFGPQRVSALIAPHIDLERGFATYASAYNALRNLGPVDRFVVLGTSHGPTSELIVPTRKDFETPLGPLRTDRAAVDRVAGALGANAFDDEFAHKNEHSIEFQAIFIKLLFPDAEFVPLLCGSLRSFVDDAEGPGENPKVENAVAAVRAAACDGKSTVFVAGADLAHVGPRFGGPKLTPELLIETEAGDRESLQFAASLDAGGWYDSVTRGGDPRNTCGLAPVYFMLRALDRGRGELLSYQRCESADQCVTIGAMVFGDGAR